MRPIRWTIRVRFPRPGRGRFRLISKPDARPVAVFRADARRAVDARFSAHGTTGKTARRPMGRKTIVVTLVVLFLAGVATAVLGSRGVRDVTRSQEELHEMEIRLVAQQETVAALRREVQRLKVDRLATERIARESLGYVRPGEITFLLPREGGAPLGMRSTPTAGGGSR